MALSRETYELVAQAVKAEVTEINARLQARRWEYGVTISAIESLASRLVTAFETDNPSFDRERFLKAAGLTD